MVETGDNYHPDAINPPGKEDHLRALSETLGKASPADLQVLLSGLKGIPAPERNPFIDSVTVTVGKLHNTSLLEPASPGFQPDITAQTPGIAIETPAATVNEKPISILKKPQKMGM